MSPARPTVETERLILRPWLPGDLAPFAALNADPAVMTHFPAPLSRAESDAFVTRLIERSARDGFGFLAVERREDGAFLGMVGLTRVAFAPIAPAVEIGWRLGRAHWGQGYATEAAAGWLDHAFDWLGLPEVIAMAVPANAPSHAVMRRLGMVRDPARDFEHPSLPEGHRLRPHILFAIDRAGWAAHPRRRHAGTDRR